MTTMLERVTAEELAWLQGMRRCNADMRAMIADIIERAARRELEALPSNVLPFPAGPSRGRQ